MAAHVVKHVFPDSPGTHPMKNRNITVQGTAVGIASKYEQDYISLTDMVKDFDSGSALIRAIAPSRHIPRNYVAATPQEAHTALILA